MTLTAFALTVIACFIGCLTAGMACMLLPDDDE